MDRFAQTLQRHWGFSTFRPGQREVIEAVVAGRPVLGVMPTGAGKSLCYQLPALMLPGVTVVVSPLIALMKDQVDQLRQRGIPAACINSTVPLDEQQRMLEDARAGHLKLLYVAPERFRYEGAMARLKRLPIGLFAIDEAHCISHWGHDFRPDYQLLGPAYRELSAPRVAAYTATATAEVRRDIVGSLGLVDPLVTVAGFARDNLHLSVLPIARMKDKPKLALAAIRAGLGANTTEGEGGVAIVYCATRKHCEEAHDALSGHGFEVQVYHGGLDDDARARAQDAFQRGKRLVMVATNAFGMGVDKPDVRVVVHWDFPGSVDAYYQEVGRAGRDGRRAYGVMLFTYADSRIHEFFIEKSGEDLDPSTRAARAEADRQKLKAIQRFAYHEGCRHAALLRYFGDRSKDCDLTDPNGSRCDNCAGSTGLAKVHLNEHTTSKKAASAAPNRAPRDIADDDNPRHAKRRLTEPEEVVVQKALSAVARAKGELEVKAIAKALRGSKATDVVKGPLFGTKSFGMLDELPEATTLALLRALARAGCISGRRPTLTALGNEVMWRRQSVLLEMPPFSHEGLKKKTPAPAVSDSMSAVSSTAEADSTLLRALKQRRLVLAKERGIAPFLIASNALLDRLATLSPDASSDDWLAVKGVGDQNLRALREAFKPLIDSAGHES